MKPITQLDPFGCGAACIAFLLNKSYEHTVEILGQKAAQTRGYGCQKICTALSTPNRKYRYKKIDEKIAHILDKDKIIVFIEKFASYPVGHYLCRRKGLWMDPWINLQSSKNLAEAYSGFRRTLPGEPGFIIHPDPETSSG